MFEEWTCSTGETMLAERQFRRMEIPAKPVTYSLFERMREDQG